MKKFLLALLLLVPLAAHAAEKETVFARVTRTGTIRCGYSMWTPILYQDLKTGTLTGFSFELMNEIGKRLNLKIDWAEETGWGTLVEGVQTGRYDMICLPIAASTGRARAIGFSVPAFFSPMYLVTRADDARFDSGTDALNDPQYKIAVLDGEMTSIVVAQTLPKASTDAIPQTADYAMLLKEVETKKADATLVTPETFADYDRNNPGLLKRPDAAHPVSIFPASFGLPIGDSALKGMIDIAVNELINDGTVNRLLKKYEKYPGTFLRATPPYQAAR